MFGSQLISSLDLPGLGEILLTSTESNFGHACSRSSSLSSPPRLMASCRSVSTSTVSALSTRRIVAIFCFLVNSSVK